MDNQKEYSRYMSNFRGVDTTSEASNVALNRFSFIQNMYKDYKSGQGVAIETFPGTRTLCRDLGIETGTDAETGEEIKKFKKIYGMHSYKVSSDKVYIIVHAGKKLYYFDKDKRDELSTDLPTEFSGITMKEAKSSSFVCNNRLYIIDGEHYISVYDNNGGLTAEYIDENNAYIPTTYSNGVQCEQRNMLTNSFKEKNYVKQIDFNTIGVPEKPPEDVIDRYYCPIVSHRHKSFDYCVAGVNGKVRNHYYSYEQSNFVSSFEIHAPYNASKITIDFTKFKVGVCSGVQEWYVTIKDKYGDFSEKLTNKRPSYLLDKAEFITPAELSKRKTDQSVCDSDGVYQYNFYAQINDELLKEDDTARRKLLTYVSMFDDVKEIEGTLRGCSNITTLKLSNSIKTLAGDFFAGTTVDTIYLPYDLEEFGESDSGKKVFEEAKCTKIYASAQNFIYDELNNNKEKYGIGENVKIISYESKYMSGAPNASSDTGEDDKNAKNRFYINTPCKTIKSVHINGAKILELLDQPAEPSEEDKTDPITLYAPVYKFLNSKWHIVAIDIYYREYKKEDQYNYTECNREINGDLIIEGEAYSSIFTTSEEASDDAMTTHKDYKGNTVEAINHCKASCAFDDRVFFAGNPDLPNTVFYTQRDLTGHNNPTYVGVLNWFDDGMGNTPNVAMMSNASTLMVLKGNTLQDGSIYYHTGADGGNDLTPRIYPSVEGLAGLGCVGMAVNFRDDCVFMSNQGLEAIAKQTVNLERTIEHRSTNIDGLMLHSELASARAAEWEGYLCILVNGKMFLADSRQAFEGIGGAMEYEWYYVADVCGYNNDNQKYFLADHMPASIPESFKPTGLSISEDEDRSVNYSEVLSSNIVRYIVRDGIPFLVDSNGEMENGTPDMACEICAVEDVLFFGTEGGKLLCLNNDKRGTNKEEPDKSRIPVEWYNNSGHAYDAVAVLAMENAGVPHYTKTTVKRGTVLRLKAFPQSSFEVYATTDRQATTLLTSQSNSVTTFDALDFENLGLLTADSGVLAIKEKTKKWVEKQYEFRNDKLNQPFGLYSITYRYTISGDVKNK